jgi:hypothetical protein
MDYSIKNFEEYYDVLPNGLIHQKKIINEIKKYDFEYVNDRYNLYGDQCDMMSYLRYGFLMGAIKEIPKSILDVGYGNGSFLKICKNSIKTCYGNDISGYPLPKNVYFVDDITKNYYDVISFFDVLEHFGDINIIKKLNCKYIYISVPECHFINKEWFWNWKHRRPDEHLWHFNIDSITSFFKTNGFDLVSSSNVEDIIRKPSDETSNILSCVFRKK